MQKILIGIIVTAVVVGGGGFYAGQVYATRAAPRTFVRNGDTMAAWGRDGHMGPQDAGRGGRMNGNVVAGAIIAADAESITVRPRDGGSRIVFTSDSTEVGKFASGTRADLTVGVNVIVTGKANDDGSVTAQSVQIRPELAPQPGA